MTTSGAVGGVILASGMSRRFGEGSKLLTTIGGVAIVRRVAETYLDAGLESVVVVLGSEADIVQGVLDRLPLKTILNPEFEQGQSRALVHGIRAVADRVAAAVVGPADQPFLAARTIRALVDAYRASGAAIVAPQFDGVRGTPVLFDRLVFSDLLAVTGDRAGRAVLADRAPQVHWIDVAGRHQAMDIDTAEDLERARALFRNDLL